MDIATRSKIRRQGPAKVGASGGGGVAQLAMDDQHHDGCQGCARQCAKHDRQINPEGREKYANDEDRTEETGDPQSDDPAQVCFESRVDDVEVLPHFGEVAATDGDVIG